MTIFVFVFKSFPWKRWKCLLHCWPIFFFSNDVLSKLNMFNISIVSMEMIWIRRQIWSYCWIDNYLCNQCLSPLTLWVQIPLRRRVLDTTLCDKVCQSLAAGRWFSPGTPVTSINKTKNLLLSQYIFSLSPLNKVRNLHVTCVATFSKTSPLIQIMNSE
jgi:hypothetical protein